MKRYVFSFDALGLILLSTVLYASSLHGHFVYDDLETIVKNPYIRDLKYVPDYFDPRNQKMWSFHHQQQQMYRPLVLTSFALNYQISGVDPFSYHLFNLILHIMNSLLVYKTVYNMARLIPWGASTPDKPRALALLTALLFASHPIQTEAVSYVVSRTSLLSTFFILCSFNGFLRSLEKEKWQKRLLQTGSLLSLVFGLLSKEITIVLPLLVLAFSMLFFVSRQDKSVSHSSFQTSLPYFGVLVIYLLLRILLFDKAALLSKKDILLPYFFASLKAVFIYLKLLFFPLGQNVDHHLPLVTNPWEFTTLFGLAGAFALGWLLLVRIRPYSKLLFFSAAWFLIALMPNLVLPTIEPISEHTVYFPSIGLFSAVGFLFVTFYYRSGAHLKYPAKVACLGFFSVLIIQLGFLTLNRNLVWQNSMLLWQDAVRKSPQKARPHLNLGNAYMSSGRLNLAIHEFQTALSLDRTNAEAWNNLGLAWTRMGLFDKAIKAFNDSIALKHFNPDAYNSLGFALISQGRYEAAIEMLKKALTMRPNDAIICANLGFVYSRIQDHEKACQYLELSVHLDPNYETGAKLYRKLCKKEGLNSKKKL
jgi:tetratricopeptide (TPR) repeat protein